MRYPSLPFSTLTSMETEVSGNVFRPWVVNRLSGSAGKIGVEYAPLVVISSKLKAFGCQGSDSGNTFKIPVSVQKDDLRLNGCLGYTGIHRAT